VTVPLTTRILLADDHTVVRGGLRMVLDAEPDLEVVAEASDGREAVEAAVENEVDLAVLVLKTAANRDLIEACRATMRGQPFLYPAAVKAVMRDFLEAARRGEETPSDPLTPRELDVVKLIAEGGTSEEIGEILFISKKTVDRHRANMLEKLGMRNRVELTRYAIRRGLVEP
jgi:DNA-binding NarL/FixJ family response regulator